MTAEAICSALVEKFGESAVSSRLDGRHAYALVSPKAWHDAAMMLRDDPRLSFNMLRCISSLDLIGDDRLAAVYDLIAMDPPDDPARGLWRNRHRFAVRHARAFAAINERFGLDYIPFDCGETPDGKLLVFEAGTNMIVHSMDPPDLFPYKPPQMCKVFGAFQAMLRGACAAEAEAAVA